MSAENQESEPTPYEKLGVLASQTVAINDQFDHTEIFTSRGLLSIMRHGPHDARNVAVCFGGALGGMLGPHKSLYHRLGVSLAEQGIGTIRVGYRKPNDLSRCIHDGLAAMEWAARQGALRFASLGHSFGGAVAVQCAAHLDAESVPGVVTFATQAAGCEAVENLTDRDLLFFHGTNDQILPWQASQMVRELAGHGTVELLDGVDHLMSPAGDELLARMEAHIPALF